MLKSSKYALVRADDLQCSYSFVPAERFGAQKIESCRGLRLNVMGADKQLLFFHLDSKAMMHFQMQLDSYLVAENDELRQELAELRGETDD